MSDLTITFHGTSAAVPSDKRGLSALTLQREGTLLLFDCGEGTQRQMMKSPVGFKAPDAIFLTHAHGDHWLGLPGLLATLNMQDHEKPLPIYMPSAMIDNVRNTLYHSTGIPKFASLNPMDPDREIPFEDEFTVSAFSTEHTPSSQGYVFEEPMRPGRFDPKLATFNGIEPGPDFKRLQNGETVNGVLPEFVMGPKRRGRKVVYTGDTAPQAATSQAAYKADLLIHEATFEYSEKGRAAKTRHSTGTDAGRVAGAANVGRLALTHFSPRSRPKIVVQEAAQQFSPVEGASDGYQIRIPLPA